MKKILLVLFAAFVLANLAAWGLQINDTITEEDRAYTDSLMQECKLPFPQTKAATFDLQVEQIRAIQHCVLQHSMKYKDIPMFHTRNLRDFYEAKHGFCFDMSYAMEKILRQYGYEIRHASIYQTGGRNFLLALGSTQTRSHALCEVLTEKGWMIVDSLIPFLGLRNEQAPYDLKSLRQLVASGKFNPNEFEETLDIYTKDYVVVYGLYSRHGKFYPPYNFVPDFQYRQLWYNCF